MALCPICFSELGTFSDDPIMCTPSLSSSQYEGFTQIKPTHIIELQNDRNLIETQLGLSLTEWTPINNTDFFQGLYIYIQELRMSTEAILTKQGISKDIYFNYDKEGNYMGTNQTDWHNIDLITEKSQIKAIHIEDLRHTALRILTGNIIVHCHNLEGKEINSITNVNITSAKIYDGDALIGYGAHNNDTHNIPIEVSSGNHQIKVIFNGITLTQDITLELGETKILTFEFTRTDFDLVTLLNTNAIDDSILMSGYIAQNESRGFLNTKYLSPDIVGYLFTPGERGNLLCGINYMATWELTINTNIYHDRIAASIDLVDWGGIGAGTRITSVLSNEDGNPGSGLYIFDGRNWTDVARILIPGSIFQNWYIQKGIQTGTYPNIIFAEKENFYNYVTMSIGSYGVFLLDATKAYRKAHWLVGIGDDAWVYAYGVHHAEFEYENNGSVSTWNMSSVPYDLDGTAV